MTWKVTMKKWAWTEHFWIISGSLRAPGWQAPSRYSYPAMELTAQIEGVSSPSPKRQVEADGPASETSQRRLYPPWAVLSRGALAAGAHGCLLCGTYTARLTQLMGLVTLRAEPQPEPKLTPAPMILTTGVSAWSMFAFSSATSGPAHPLSLCCARPHTTPGQQSVFTEGVSLPRFPSRTVSSTARCTASLGSQENSSFKILSLTLPCVTSSNRSYSCFSLDDSRVGWSLPCSPTVTEL